MARVIANFPPSFYEALKAEGYVLPDETADISLEIPVDGLLQLVLRINLTEETLRQVGYALVRMSNRNFEERTK